MRAFLLSPTRCGLGNKELACNSLSIFTFLYPMLRQSQSVARLQAAGPQPNLLEKIQNGMTLRTCGTKHYAATLAAPH